MASRFWVGGTGTWDSTTTTHWSASTGGAGGASAPTTGDVVTFDGNSGASAVITADTTINNISLASITMGALVGTLDLSAVTNMTLTATPGLSVSGAGVRTLSLPSGTLTVSVNNAGAWDFLTTTNLTFNHSSGTVSFTGNPAFASGTRVIILSGSGARTYNNVTLAGGTGGGNTSIQGTGAITIAGTLAINSPFSSSLSWSGGLTCSNAFTWAGTAFNSAIMLTQSSGTTSTLTAASGSTIAWGVLQGITFAGTAVNATNSIDLKGNQMNGGSITGPSGGGGSSVGAFIGA